MIVYDNSPDGTGEVAKKMGSRDGVNAIVRKNKKGLASAIRKGIESSSGDIIVVMDTDLSHPPEVIPELLNNLGDSDIVIASRYVEGGDMVAKRYKFFLSKLLNYFIRVVLGLNVNDSTGGFLAIRRKTLDSVDKEKVFVGYGDYCFRLLYELKGNARIKEIPFTYGSRRYGESKTPLIRIGFSYVLEALRIRLGL